MNKRNVDESKQPAVKPLLMKGWVKKALPFVQNGLRAAKVYTILGLFCRLVYPGRDPCPLSFWITLYCPGFAKPVYLSLF
jgi:hypothetical protein